MTVLHGLFIWSETEIRTFDFLRKAKIVEGLAQRSAALSPQPQLQSLLRFCLQIEPAWLITIPSHYLFKRCRDLGSFEPRSLHRAGSQAIAC
jgi:hypothetical protein